MSTNRRGTLYITVLKCIKDVSLYGCIHISVFICVSNRIRQHFSTTPTCRRGFGPASSPPPEPRPQAVGEDDPGPDGAEREAAPHPADLLQRQPATGRPDEGAAGGDDRPEPQGDPRLVSEQALQRQEEVHPDEADPAAAAQRQNRESAQLFTGCLPCLKQWLITGVYHVTRLIRLGLISKADLFIYSFSIFNGKRVINLLWMKHYIENSTKVCVNDQESRKCSCASPLRVRKRKTWITGNNAGQMFDW